jgi:hypothetical protein
MGIASPCDGLQMPRELACEFFAVFARFEFALKEAGYVYVNRFKRAAPDWDRFASEAGAKLQVPAGSELDAAVAYLTDAPPQVQTSAQGWSEVPLRGDVSVARALDAVQRVRNNLFHGGKHTPHSAPGRDEKLVRLALVILSACLAQDGNLRYVFEQHAF